MMVKAFAPLRAGILGSIGITDADACYPLVTVFVTAPSRQNRGDPWYHWGQGAFSCCDGFGDDGCDVCDT